MSGAPQTHARLGVAIALVAAALSMILLVAFSIAAPPALAEPTYEELLWAPWPRRPTDSEIEQARKVAYDEGQGSAPGGAGAVAPDVGESGASDLSQFNVTAVEAVKVHEVDGEPRLGGEPETGNHVVAAVTFAHGGSNLRLLFWNGVSGRWEFGPAAIPETESLDALYASGYAPGWVEAGAAAGGEGPWRTVASGGLAAVAVAIAADAARRLRRRGRLDDRTPVGYVLEVSAMELRLSPSAATPFGANAWRVLASGGVEPADDVTITLAPPAGVGADPASARTALTASVWRTAELATAATLGVVAVGAGGGTQASVGLVPDEALQLSFAFPAGPSPKVFTSGWVFGARAIAYPGTANERDVSDTVEWSGTGSFFPPVGALSRPHFHAEGDNTITLRVEDGGRVVSQTLTVCAVSPARYAHVGSASSCPADVHGCPGCPHSVMGLVAAGSPTVTVDGAPAARQGDGGNHVEWTEEDWVEILNNQGWHSQEKPSPCCGENTFVIAGGDPEVLIDGRPAARIGDPTQHCGGAGTLVS